jgi:hypothetical protein
MSDRERNKIQLNSTQLHEKGIAEKSSPLAQQKINHGTVFSPE